jgi:UDP-N-acetylglucosamine diphosphorylase/glucosamine-1-phosphate N-acetyltransferase
MLAIFTDAFQDWQNFLPLTFNKPIAKLRIGILTIEEKWQKYLQILPTESYYLSQNYLHKKFPRLETIGQNTTQKLYLNTTFLPDKELCQAIQTLPKNSILVSQNTIVAVLTEQVFATNAEVFTILENPTVLQHFQQINYAQKISRILYVYDIFRENRQQIIQDFALLTHNRKSFPITDIHTKVYGAKNIFLEEGATIKAAILNAEDAPIYIGKNAKVHEGAIIKGAFALCEGAEVNMATKIKGDTTIGVFSKVGGEISNSVIMGYSNKGHDGFLGNSVLGEWCNLGADTNTSNLKNNYSNVKLWNFVAEKMLDTDLQFCGTIMGDHAKCSINTMLNTATVVGIGANLFGADFPPKFVPPFAWGGSNGFETFAFDKFCAMADKVMQRRGIVLSNEDREILEIVFSQTQKYRNW